MPWTNPVAGVAGTVITEAWSTANVVNPLMHLRALTGGADPSGSGQIIVSTSTSAATWQTPGAYVPSGTIVAFNLLSELTAAGAGWARWTPADGMMLIGAGTSFSQTFAESTAYGSNWTPSSNLSITESDASTTALAAPGGAPGSFTAGQIDHRHGDVIANKTNAWIPPSRSVIWGRKT
jgi:hypothetical protein